MTTADSHVDATLQGSQQPDRVYAAGKRTRFAEDREDIRGRHVFDSHGHELGIVDSVLLDSQSHHVRFFQVRTRTGFLGLHRHTATIPVDVIARVEAEAVYLDRPRRAAETGPKLGEGSAGLNEGGLLAVYRHFHVSPFWDAAYVTPLFHSHSHTPKHLHHPHG